MSAFDVHSSVGDAIMNTNRRKSWMWAEACALLDEAERKHRRFFELLAVPSSHPVWEPPADIFADGSELRVVVALPGARVEEVVVQITPSGLQIETLVPPPSLSAHMNVVRLEIPYGRMRRRIDLPPGHYALVERQLDRGCLFLRLRREAQ
jgi:HSP20 family molecular chaperone IbpA